MSTLHRVLCWGHYPTCDNPLQGAERHEGQDGIQTFVGVWCSRVVVRWEGPRHTVQHVARRGASSHSLSYQTFLPLPPHPPIPTPTQMLTERKLPRTRSSKQTFNECDSTSPPAAIDSSHSTDCGSLPAIDSSHTAARVEGHCYCPFINKIMHSIYGQSFLMLWHRNEKMFLYFKM